MTTTSAICLPLRKQFMLTAMEPSSLVPRRNEKRAVKLHQHEDKCPHLGEAGIQSKWQIHDEIYHEHHSDRNRAADAPQAAELGNAAELQPSSQGCTTCRKQATKCCFSNAFLLLEYGGIF